VSWYLAALRKYAVFSGRSRRKEFWYFTLFDVIVGVLVGIVGLILLPSVGAGPFSLSLGAVALPAIYGLLVLIPSLAVLVRRLHDTGRTGWWWLVGFVPVFGEIVLLVFMLQDSEAAANEYGPNPKLAPNLAT